jgi:hypothetical protein
MQPPCRPGPHFAIVSLDSPLPCAPPLTVLSSQLTSVVARNPRIAAVHFSSPDSYAIDVLADRFLFVARTRPGDLAPSDNPQLLLPSAAMLENVLAHLSGAALTPPALVVRRFAVAHKRNTGVAG